MPNDKITINVEDLSREAVSPEVPPMSVQVPYSTVSPPPMPKIELPKNNSRFVATIVLLNCVLTLFLCGGVGYLIVSEFTKNDSASQQDCESREPSDTPLVQPTHITPVPDASGSIVIPFLDETIEIQSDTKIISPMNENTTTPFINPERNSTSQ